MASEPQNPYFWSLDIPLKDGVVLRGTSQRDLKIVKIVKNRQKSIKIVKMASGGSEASKTLLEDYLNP